MSANSRDETSGADREQVPASERYAGLETASTYILYDRKNHQAWLESDLALTVDTMR